MALTSTEHGKSQGVRLMDVFLLGPFMVWFGMKTEDVPEAARLVMIVAGMGTIALNGANYLRIREQSREG